MTRFLVLVVIHVSWLVVAPAVAFAKPKVALVPIEDGEVQDAVVDALGADDLALVGPKQVSRAVDKLGLEGDLTEKQLRKLATELEADAVIQGSLTNKGSNRVLHFKLFVRGKTKKGFKIEFASATSKKFKQALHDKMVEKIGSKAGGDDEEAEKPGAKKKGGGDDEEAEKPPAKEDKAAAKKKKKGGDDDDKAAAKKKKGGGGDDEDPLATDKKGGGDKDKAAAKKKKGGGDEGDEPLATKKKGGDEEAEALATKKKGGGDEEADKDKKEGAGDEAGGDDDKKAKKKTTAKAGDEGDSEEIHARAEVEPATATVGANRVAIRAGLGPSVTGRSLTFNSRQFTEGIGSPKPYSNPPVFGARVDGEVYPLAISNPFGGAAGLGLGGMYDKTISLNLHNQLMPGASYAANEFRWNLGARYRLVFGSKVTSPSVTIGVDYGHRQFTIARPDPSTGIIIDIPDVEYVGVTPSVFIRLPVAPSVAIIVGGGSMLLLRAGSIQNPEQYGRAKVTEAEAEAGIDVVLNRRMALRFTGEFAQFGFQFVGNGAMANARDGDPSNIDVGGALDRYIGGALTFSVMY
jgi:hypothetical protein